MRRLILLLTLLSTPTYADAWVGVAEYMAFATDKDGIITEAESGLNNRRFPVDASGVREVGDEVAFFISVIH